MHQLFRLLFQMFSDRGTGFALLFRPVLTGPNGGIGSGQPLHAGKGQTVERQEVHQPITGVASRTIQKLRGNAGCVVSSVWTVQRIAAADGIGVMITPLAASWLRYIPSKYSRTAASMASLHWRFALLEARYSSSSPCPFA